MTLHKEEIIELCSCKTPSLNFRVSVLLKNDANTEELKENISSLDQPPSFLVEAKAPICIRDII